MYNITSSDRWNLKQKLYVVSLHIGYIKMEKNPIYQTPFPMVTDSVNRAIFGLVS